MADEALDISLFFKALSRPATIQGVDYDYFLIMLVSVVLAFIYTNNFLAFLLAAPLYLIGFVLCKIDPHIFRLLSVRASIGVVKNKRLWHCQSYAPF